MNYLNYTAFPTFQSPIEPPTFQSPIEPHKVAVGADNIGKIVYER